MSNTTTLWEFPQEFYDDKGTWLLEMAGGREVVVRKVGWCPRGQGHVDMPTPEDSGFGECGSKWTHEAWMSEWVEATDE